MKKSIHISIPEPCHEDWNKMTPTEKGKFCKVCTKEVFDFTKSTDEELIKKLDSGASLCGRFKKSQLDREVKLERKSKNHLLPYAASLLLPLSLLSTSEGTAQGGPHVVEKQYTSLGIGSNPLKSLVTITGFVTDADGTPLSNAEVFVLETGHSVRTKPDGSYKITCTSGSSLYSIKDEMYSEPIKLGNYNATIDITIQSPPPISITTTVHSITMGAPIIDDSQEEKKKAKTITISGRVTDENNLPLPAVNIVIKGTTSGTQTDFDGYYSIQPEAGQILTFSFLGYETAEVTISNISNTIDHQMMISQEELLGDVVVGRFVPTESTRDVNNLFGYEPRAHDPEREAKIKKRKQAAANEVAFKKIQQARKKAARIAKRKKKK
ncbi:MAG: carboxypeptidase-like regulatory domain-containing protein [Bacteroidota bacterium]